MEAVQKWLQSVRARDVMTKQVDSLRPSDRLVDAVSLFLSERISGAPVTDDSGECVGVLSATDVMSFDEHFARQSRAIPTRHKTKHCRAEPWDPAHWWRKLRPELESQCNESVDRFMTRDIVFVTEDAPLSDIVEQMVSAHVHRILVLDDARHLKGIITTMDVLALLTRVGQREPRVAMAGRSVTAR